MRRSAFLVITLNIGLVLGYLWYLHAIQPVVVPTAPTRARPKPTTGFEPLHGSGKTIAIVTATRSLPSWKPGQSALETILVPSLLRTIGEPEQFAYTIRLYVGIDFGDAYWENAREHVGDWSQWLDIRFGFYALDSTSKNRIPFREVSAAAIADGADYVVRVNDDTEFVTARWISRGIQALMALNPPNVGVVGPLCRQGNTGILTHDMIHSTHYAIFGWHYPPEFDNWWLDDWISKVYGPERTKTITAWEVKHHLGHSGTRYSVDTSQKKLLKAAIDRGKVAIAAYTSKPPHFQDECGNPGPSNRRCWELPPWNYTHTDFPGIFGASPAACRDPSSAMCATAGEPSGAATASFLRALEPYITCEPPGSVELEPLNAKGATCKGKPLDTSKRFVVDFFGVAHDIDIAEIRIAELSPVVDMFVIFESDVTDRGDPKPLYFERIMHRFASIQARIVYMVIGKWHSKHHSLKRKASQVREDNWAHENIRAHAFDSFKHDFGPELPESTIVLHGDADEFFDRKSAYAIKYCPDITIRGAVGPSKIVRFANVAIFGKRETVRALHSGKYPVAFPLSSGKRAFHNCELAHPELSAYDTGGFLNPYATLAKEVSAAEGAGIMTRYADARDRIARPWLTNAITMNGIRTCCRDSPPGRWDSNVPFTLQKQKSRYGYLWGNDAKAKRCFPHVWAGIKYEQ